MQFSSEKAEICASEALDRMANSRDAKDRLLYAAACKLGIDEVVSELSSRGGRIYRRFEATGRYMLPVDDMRSIVNNMVSTARYNQEKSQRFAYV